MTATKDKTVSGLGIFVVNQAVQKGEVEAMVEVMRAKEVVTAEMEELAEVEVEAARIGLRPLGRTKGLRDGITGPTGQKEVGKEKAGSRERATRVQKEKVLQDGRSSAQEA